MIASLAEYRAWRARRVVARGLRRPVPSPLLSHAIRWLSSKGAKAPVLSGCVVAIAAVGIVDTFTAPVLSLALFYSLPVIIVAWALGRRAGIAAAVAAGLLGVVVYIAHPHGDPIGISAWNATTRTVFYIILALLVAGQRQLHDELEELASIDTLTGTLNRRAFLVAAHREFERALRMDLPVAILFADIDGLKAINDTEGHDAGDALIARFGMAAKTSVRSIDLVGRMGGDEFAILLPGAVPAVAQEIGDRLTAALQDDGPGTAIFASLGMAATDRVTGDVESLLQEADAAMYQIKRSRGGGQSGGGEQ